MLTPFFLKCCFGIFFPSFFRARNSAKHPKNIPYTLCNSDQRIFFMQRSADFSGKRVFWGEKEQDPEQNKDLETKHKLSRVTPKIFVWHTTKKPGTLKKKRLRAG